MQIKWNKKVLSGSGSNNQMPVLDGINSQIKILRSMMLCIDDRSSRVETNKVNDMRSSIMCGSVYPLQNLEAASLFFYS